MRKCIKCPATESPLWYRGPLCKKCYQQRWQRENKNKVAGYVSGWKNRNKEKDRERHLKPNARFVSARNSALTRGKIWSISLKDFTSLIALPCYYCFDEMGAGDNYGSGLDRINNTIDYQLDNVIPCCKICNSMRNNYLTMEETTIAVRAIISYRKSRVDL